MATDHCSSPLIIQTADKMALISFVHRVFVLIIYSLCKSVVSAFREFFKHSATACKVTRYGMACLIGFTWSKVTSVGADIWAFESTGIYSFNRHNVPEYLFSVLDTSEP